MSSTTNERQWVAAAGPAGDGAGESAQGALPAPLTRGARPARKALPGHGRTHNRTLVLQTLYREGPLSRADLARTTGLTKVTVSDLVQGLIDETLVVEAAGATETNERNGRARPGKPGTPLDFDRAAFDVIAVDLSDHAIFRGAVLDVDGAVRARLDLERGDATGADAVELVVELVERLGDLTTRRILGVGIGTPGVVDEEGRVLTAPKLGWSELPLRELVAERTGFVTVAANDANVAVRAEHSFGANVGDLMLVRIGHGLGSGLVIGDRLVVGSRFAAGEIGQVMVGTDAGIESPYRTDEILEHWLTVPQLLERIETAGGMTNAEPVLREAGQRLGVALAPVVGALNLAELVLCGPVELVDGPLADALLETIRNRTMRHSHDALAVRMSELGDDIVLRGAAALLVFRQLGLT